MGKRRSMFQAPSIDEEAEVGTLSRRNLQIALFAVGFIFPFGKLIPYDRFLVKSLYRISEEHEN